VGKRKRGIDSTDRPRSSVAKGRFVQIPFELFECDAYSTLPSGAQCLLIEFIKLCWPDRNGRVGMSQDRASSIAKCSKKTAAKYLELLLERGFIKLTKGELWQQRLAREYAVTSVSRQGRKPTFEYLQWNEGQNFFGGNKKFTVVNETPALGKTRPQKRYNFESLVDLEYQPLITTKVNQ